MKYTREQILAMNLEELNLCASDLRSLLEKTESNDEMDQIQKLIETVQERKSQIKEEIEQRKRDMLNVAGGLGNPIEVRVTPNIEVRNTQEYIDAYAEYIKTGDDRECRKLTSTNDTTPNGTGTVPIPEFVYDIVKHAWEKEGIMSLVRKSYLKGNLKVGFEISGDDAYIHNEGAGAVSEEDLVLGIVEIVPKSIKKWISISDEVYDLRGEAFLRYIYEELSYKIAKKAADTVIAKIEACGTMSTTTCPGIPKLTRASASIGDVAQAIAYLSDEAANPVILMNKLTWGTYKAIQAANGYNYDPFEGLPVIFNNTIKAYSAATTGNTYMIVGDLGHGALANFPNGEGITFKFDEMSRKKEDLIEVLGREYVGIGVVAPGAFVKVVK